ncbi:hypothetical protein LTR78_002433 [Recurvomyces mirabilis]|uniref:DNA damage-responsive protein 48 n=1 Tax=Recurvomyces mirabilis TaxID=574656 RepID=A0AAE0WTM2_9PEZI|nr:hypothetical protein LTR78_002433 [Recurvomyces mirabilis]KAK5157362.1 hypothetical protein LTS14_004127 [Recurvomyces mirabilis]
MDFIKNAMGNQGGQGGQGSSNQMPQGQGQQQQGGGGGFMDGLGNKFNNAAGGGAEGEKNEDYLDKGVDFVQEKFMGQGAQNNETAVEQAKDEQISDFIRKQYKSTTGSDIPIKDKPTTFG